MGKKGLTNFSATLTSLKKFVAEPIRTERDKAGVIQAFEFTFEQCWKALQFEAQNQGVQAASPKSAFTFALANSLIPSDQESLWLKMIEDRNLTVHTYKQELADQVVARIQSDYIRAFDQLLVKLQGNKN